MALFNILEGFRKVHDSQVVLCEFQMDDAEVVEIVHGVCAHTFLIHLIALRILIMILIVVAAWMCIRIVFLIKG